MKQAGINETIHKSFRVWLFETGIRVQQTDFTAPASGRLIIPELRKMLTALDRKCFLETRFFFPALALQAPFSVTLLEDQNREVQVQAHSLGRLLGQYTEPGTTAHYAQTGQAIQDAFCRLVSQLMVYMNQQDTLFRESPESADHKKASLEEIAALLSDGMDRSGWIAFLLRGMGPQEISQWLDKATDEAPAEKWAILATANPALYAQLRRQSGRLLLQVAA
jgi:hypothetical protein